MTTFDEAAAAVSQYGTTKYEQGVTDGLDQSAPTIVALQAQVDALTSELTSSRKVKWGVNGHSTFLSSVYQDQQEVADTIVRLGASWVRDRLSAWSDHPQVAQWQFLASQGVTVNALVGATGTTESKTALQTNLVKLAPTLRSIEAMNEPDAGTGLTDARLAEVVAWYKWLYPFVKSQPALQHLPVLSPALRDRNANLQGDWKRLLDALAGYYDVVNIHLYPLDLDGLTQAYLESRTGLLPVSAKGKPIAVTEVGFNTMPAGGVGGFRVTEAQQAKLTTDAIRLLAKFGVEGTVYELLDDPTPTSDYQSWFGIVGATSNDSSGWRDKQAAKDLQALAAGTLA